MREYPRNVQALWEEHYVAYAGAVFVMGFKLGGDSISDSVDVLVAGNYRWIPAHLPGNWSLQVGGVLFTDESPRWLEAGVHRVDGSAGVASKLVLALPVDPDDAIHLFYHPRRVRNLVRDP